MESIHQTQRCQHAKMKENRAASKTQSVQFVLRKDTTKNSVWFPLTVRNRTKKKIQFPSPDSTYYYLNLTKKPAPQSSKLAPQSRKPVLRHTAFRTWRRSLPFNVLPTPSSTEAVVLGDRPEARATISWGGNISSSSSSSSASARVLLLALDWPGTFIGADWWNFPMGRDCECLLSVDICGGLGIAGTALIGDGNEVFRFSSGGLSVAMFRSESGKVASIPLFSDDRKLLFGSTRSFVHNTSSSLKSPPVLDESPVAWPDWPDSTPRRRRADDRRWLGLGNPLPSISKNATGTERFLKW